MGAARLSSQCSSGYRDPLASADGASQPEESGPPESENNGVSFDGTVPDCDVCAVGKSHQRAHPKTADQYVQRPFQLVFTYLMGYFTPEALGGYKYVSKISDEHTRWTEIYLLKSKDSALHAFQSFV